MTASHPTPDEHQDHLASTASSSNADVTLPGEPLSDVEASFGEAKAPLPEEEEEIKGEGWRDNKKGWIVLLSPFLVNFFCFGMVFSWGNFQQLYLTIYEGQTNTFAISFVGNMTSAILLCSGLVLPPIIAKLGYRGTMAIGTIIAPLALILCSYATQLWHIYLAQGLLFGIGCGLLFSSSVALPAQFFSRNRAFAVGIAVSASGIGGVSLSPMTTHLIETLGYRQALRVLGAFGFGLLIIATALAFSKHRPTIKGSYFSSIIDTSIVNREFVILLVYGFLATFGYLAPYFLAPQYATYLGYDIETGANMVSVMSGMNAVSRIICGFFADRLGKLNMLAGTSLAAGIFAMVMWQFSTSYNVYVGFCVLYGLTSSVFVSLLPAILADIVGVRKIQQGIGMAYSIAFFGSLVGPAIAGILLQQFGWTAAIQFSGAPTVAGGLVVLYLRHLRSNGKFFCII